MSNYMDRVEKRTPPSTVIFGEQVAFIPAVPIELSGPLSRHTMSLGLFADLYKAARFGSWINLGEKITGFGIWKHEPKCIWCGLIGFGGHGRVVTSVYSPLSGLVIYTADDVLGYDYRKKMPDDLEGGKAMLAVLLPNNATAPETADKAFEEFCNTCSQYRRVIFFNSELKGFSTDVWSNEKLDHTLYNLRKRKIIVRPLSSLPYKEEVDELKRQYPANF